MIPAEETFNGTWPYTANFSTAAGFKQHYVDEGPRDRETIICLHGEPTWAYLYRNFIPKLSFSGMDGTPADSSAGTP